MIFSQFKEQRTHLRATDTLHENLRRALQFTEKTQADVSEALGVSRATVSAWHSGASLPTRHNLARLAEFLGVTESYLLGNATSDMSDLVASPEFLQVHQELRGLSTIDEAERAERLREIAAFIRYLRSRK